MDLFVAVIASSSLPKGCNAARQPVVTPILGILDQARPVGILPKSRLESLAMPRLDHIEYKQATRSQCLVHLTEHTFQFLPGVA